MEWPLAVAVLNALPSLEDGSASADLVGALSAIFGVKRK